MTDLRSLSKLLPSEVTIDISLEAFNGNKADKESYADIKIEDSILAGDFDGYCVDTDIGVLGTENDLTAKVFSIYENFLIDKTAKPMQHKNHRVFISDFTGYR